VSPLLLVGREELPEVPEPAGAQQGVDHRMGEDVGVRVPRETAIVLDLDPPDQQSLALGEAVAVVPDADPQRHQAPAPPEPEPSAAPSPVRPSGSSRLRRCSKTEIRSTPRERSSSIACS